MSARWTIAACAVAAAVGLCGDFTHYTWWVFLQFGVFCALQAAGVGHRIVVFLGVQCIVVIGAVIGMSALQCTVLVDAANEWNAAYVPLNMLVHYIPFAALVAFAPRTRPACLVEQITAGVAVFAMYACNRDVGHTYGCTTDNAAGLAWAAAVGGVCVAFQQHVERLFWCV